MRGIGELSRPKNLKSMQKEAGKGVIQVPDQLAVTLVAPSQAWPKTSLVQAIPRTGPRLGETYPATSRAISSPNTGTPTYCRMIGRGNSEIVTPLE